MKGIFKRAFVLFLVCALFLTGGVLQVAMADQGLQCPTPPKTHTVSYEYEGVGKNDLKNYPPLPETESYAEGAPVIIEDDPIKTGYRFTGWYSYSDKITSEMTGFDMPNHDVTLKGKWTKVYTVSYEYEGAIPPSPHDIAPTDPNVYEKDHTATLLWPTVPAGYAFEGWRLNGSSQLWDDDTYKFKKKESVTFIGKWTATDYFVTYAFGGEVMPPNVTKPTDDSAYHAGVGVPVLVPGGDYTGFIFSGWKMEDGTLVSGTFPMPAKNVTLTGWFEEKAVVTPTIKVTYAYSGIDLGIANANPSSALPQEIAEHKVTDPIPLPSRTHDDYKFLGWKYEGYLEGDSYSLPDGYDGGDITITGVWEKKDTPVDPPVDPPVNPPVVVIPAYYVTYTYAGVVPSGAPAVPTLSAYFVGSSVKVAPVPQLAGYSFSGWVTADVTVANGVFAQPYKDVTFTGSWVRGSARVPNTGEAQMLLLPGIFLAAGVALAAAAFTIRSKRRGR